MSTQHTESLQIMTIPNNHWIFRQVIAPRGCKITPFPLYSSRWINYHKIDDVDKGTYTRLIDFFREIHPYIICNLLDDSRFIIACLREPAVAENIMVKVVRVFHYYHRDFSNQIHEFLGIFIKNLKYNFVICKRNQEIQMMTDFVEDEHETEIIKPYLCLLVLCQPELKLLRKSCNTMKKRLEKSALKQTQRHIIDKRKRFRRADTARRKATFFGSR